MCKNFKEKGWCKYGDRCLFAHGDHELMRNQKAQDEKKEEEKSLVPAEESTKGITTM